MKSSAQPFQPPRRTSRSPSAIRRASARISAHVSSAVASVRTSGVLVTTMPRDLTAGDVDVVVADRDVRDDLQLRRGIQHRARRCWSVSRQISALLVGDAGPSARRRDHRVGPSCSRRRSVIEPRE